MLNNGVSMTSIKESCNETHLQRRHSNNCHQATKVRIMVLRYRKSKDFVSKGERNKA